MSRPVDPVARAQGVVRRAIRDTLSGFGCESTTVLIACSGGPDSMTLAAATAQVLQSPRFRHIAAGAVIVDHGLQHNSAEVAARAAGQCTELGLDPVDVVRSVPTAGGRGGPEAAAREVRYRALDAAAAAHSATAVFLGHTADDQAETVLLGLARGSGPRALAGMPARRDNYYRPLLDLPRSVVRAAYPEQEPWRDPHNDDPRFARSRVRHRVLPLLEQELGPGFAEALARSAAQVRADVEAVDAWAQALSSEHVRNLPEGGVWVDARALEAVPSAVVTRIMRDAAIRAGATGAALTSVHLTQLAALVGRWRGQGPLNLPGSVLAQRSSGTVVLGSGTSRGPGTNQNP